MQHNPAQELPRGSLINKDPPEKAFSIMIDGRRMRPASDAYEFHTVVCGVDSRRRRDPTMASWQHLTDASPRAPFQKSLNVLCRTFASKRKKALTTFQAFPPLSSLSPKVFVIVSRQRTQLTPQL